MLFKQTEIKSLGAYAINGANTVAFAPGTKSRLKRLTFVITTAHTTTKAVLTLQRRPIAGTAANQVTLGVIEIPSTGAVAGDVYYFEFGKPFDSETEAGTDPHEYTINEAGSQPLIDVGEDFAVVSDGGGDGGVANVYLTVEEEPFVGTAELTRVS